MIFDSNYQFYIFLNALYAGVIAALTYDVFSILIFGKSKRVFFKDIIFWILCAVFVLYFLIIRTDLLFRGYILLGILLGWIIYVILFSKLIRYVLTFINDKISNALNKTAGMAKKTADVVKKKTSPATVRIKKYLSIPFFEIKRYNKFKKSIKKGNAHEKKKKQKKVQ